MLMYSYIKLGHFYKNDFSFYRKYFEKLQSDLNNFDTTAFGREISTQIYPAA